MSRIKFAPSGADFETREVLGHEADLMAVNHLRPLLPCRVRVVQHYTDRADSVVTDDGRVGILRSMDWSLGRNVLWGYVTEMSPGDDGNPSRYLSPRSLLPVRTPGAALPAIAADIAAWRESVPA